MALTAAVLSGSSGGRPILVAATASTGTVLHDTDTSATIYHRVHLFGTNSSTAAATLTVEFGGTSTGDRITLPLPSQSGLLPILENMPLVGTGAAVRTVRAFASVANAIGITGWVNKHTTS